MTEVTAQPADFAVSLLARRASTTPPPWGGMGKPKNLIAFTYGLPDEPSFPSKELAEATSAVLAEHPAASLQYGPATPLVQYLQKFIENDQGIKLGPENLIVTPGSGSALAFFCRLLIEPGDYIVVEGPTFLGAVKTFKNADAEIAEVNMDDEGLILEELDATLSRLKSEGKRVKFLYTIPTFHNPKGITMGLERRKALLEIVNRHKILVLEDDAYHGLVYEGKVPPWLWTLDPYGIVFHCGTFSKTLAPSMRLGWIGGRADMIARISTVMDGMPTSTFTAYAAAKFAEDGHLARHTQKLIEIYRKKRDRMLSALERYMPDGSRWTFPQGGFFVWLELPDGVDTVKMLPKAVEAGVSYLSGTACYASDNGRNCIRLAFSLVKLEEIEPGLRKLGEVIQKELDEEK